MAGSPGDVEQLPPLPLVAGDEREECLDEVDSERVGEGHGQALASVRSGRPGRTVPQHEALELLRTRAGPHEVIASGLAFKSLTVERAVQHELIDRLNSLHEVDEVGAIAGVVPLGADARKKRGNELTEPVMHLDELAEDE